MPPRPGRPGRYGRLLAGSAALFVLAVLGLPAATAARAPAAAEIGAPPAAPHAAPAQGSAILGAAVTILADGTLPWEDRPMAVAGLGTLPGVRGRPDPGDDLGPNDAVVRSWDAVVYRASFSVRDAAAENVVAEVTLSDLAVWEPGQVNALRLVGCPGGVTLSDGGHRLRCNVGNVSAPPAVTVALDLSARVSGAALQGDRILASLTVRSPGAQADSDAANCPSPQVNGCDAEAAPVEVSAAPAAELRKTLTSVYASDVGGVAGRLLTWQLDAILGADGDVRGSSVPVGAPWALNDWWRSTGPSNRTVDIPVTLIGCTDLDARASWTCTQPGGVGTPLDVSLNRFDVDATLPNGVASSLPQVIARLSVALWVPEAEILDVKGDVTFRNCFATELGVPNRTIWRPVDARGQPNLGGVQEPAENNCSFVVLPVPRAPVPPRVPPRRNPRPRPGPPGRPPRIVTPTPVAIASKHYMPITRGASVTDGSEFAAEVVVQVAGGGTMPAVMACDKWDNSTHVLRDGGVSGARVWSQAPGAARVDVTDSAEVLLEYGTGSWGRKRPSGFGIGRSWFAQATSSCADSMPVSGPGWIRSTDVDFSNQGQRRIDARDVNAIRASFLNAIPVGTTVWLELLFKAEQNPPGTWLMNYGSVHSGTGSRSVWQVPECYGAQGSRSRRECPVPAAGTASQPGPLGDMLLHVGVPIWIVKRTNPVVPGGSPVINAGQTVGFALAASTYPRPGDPPPPTFPPEAFAPGVVLTDTLPLGLTYQVGTSTIASEDLNNDGDLDPGEDRNGNGIIDIGVSFEPTVTPGPGAGETTLQWELGDLPYRRQVPVIQYRTRVSRLLRGGTAIANQAAISASNDRSPDCSLAGRSLEGARCAWAQIIVANIAAAQVEKVPVRPWVLPGDPMVYRLALANLTNRPVEWFDAVDILPRAGEPRTPVTRITGGIADVEVVPLPGGAPFEVWASAADPAALDTLGGSPRDGIVDPVAAWGGPGAGLGGADWPCRLADVGKTRCGAIGSSSLVTALRIWGPDPKPAKTGDLADSFLPAGAPPRWLDVTLHVPGSVTDDVANNAWGGRFESLPLPVFDDALIRVGVPPTPTPIGTPVPSATITPVPDTPTATPARFSIYLPMALRVSCSARAVDAVLVMDASSSMRRPAGDGGTKQEAVLRAARAFLDQFSPAKAGGRVAVVAFHNRAWVVQPLTSDRALLENALAAMPNMIEEGTRLDLGLLVGAEALMDPSPGAVRAMVFLTDGIPNRIPTPPSGGSQEDVVLEAAESVRSRGIDIHSVGYGTEHASDWADRINPQLLIAIAGSRGAYHETDDAGVLAEVFRRVAAEVSCAAERVWP